MLQVSVPGGVAGIACTGVGGGGGRGVVIDIDVAAGRAEHPGMFL